MNGRSLALVFCSEGPLTRHFQKDQHLSNFQVSPGISVPEALRRQRRGLNDVASDPLSRVGCLLLCVPTASAHACIITPSVCHNYLRTCPFPPQKFQGILMNSTFYMRKQAQ